MKTYQELTKAIMDGSGSTPPRADAVSAARAKKKLSPSLLCRFFFQSGYCRNGEACRFSHTANDMTREEALKTIPCPFYARGSCNYGDHCELKHEEVLTKNNAREDAICGICLESVQDMKRNFGILSCCDHVFCHCCLMAWRTEGSREVERRVCPTCRKTSDYVVPSLYMPRNETEKQQVLQNYKDNLSTIPCKNFEVGKLGSCSFGRDCFYAHLDRKGKDIKKKDKSMEQLYQERQARHGRRGSSDDDDINYITEMLLLMGLQRHLARDSNRRREGGGVRGQRAGESDEDEDADEESVDIFLSDIMESLMDDEEDFLRFFM